jgi:phospho-N-acetylmuramoyl-pentapeptide-transferase
MFYWLIDAAPAIPGLNVFRYITFRTGGAMVTAALFVFLFGPWIIDNLRIRQGKGQPIRTDGPQSHLVTKKGTPTMGGLMILSGLVVSTLLWANPLNPYVWIVLGVTLGFGMVGFYDDYLKVTKQTHNGFAGRTRLLIEAVIAAAACFALVRLGREPLSSSLAIPFIKEAVLNLGWFFVIFGAFIIVGAGNAVNLTDGLDGFAIVPVMIAGTSNAVNLTDGLDGLATGCSTMVFGAYTIMNIWQQNQSCKINPGNACYEVRDPLDLAVLASAITGACFGFLWWNASPAKIFMGDTGSLALGGMLGSIAVAVKHEIVLAVIGGLFVLEAVSVIVQVASFKLTGKRVFKMAPIHHHFEQKGWTEPQIVIRFWIISVMLALVGLSTLKLR